MTTAQVAADTREIASPEPSLTGHGLRIRGESEVEALTKWMLEEIRGYGWMVLKDYRNRFTALLEAYTSNIKFQMAVVANLSARLRALEREPRKLRERRHRMAGKSAGDPLPPLPPIPGFVPPADVQRVDAGFAMVEICLKMNTLGLTTAMEVVTGEEDGKGDDDESQSTVTVDPPVPLDLPRM